MKVTMLLCDHAQVADGKLFISGGGISWVGAGAPTSLGFLFAVPWNQTTTRHEYSLDLLDTDGHAVQVNNSPVHLAGEFSLVRPKDAVVGATLDIPFAVNFGPFGLNPGRYMWQLTIDDKADPDWSLPFNVRNDPVPN